MPAITTIVAVMGIAAAIGGTVAQQQAAKKQRKAAKKNAKEAREAAAVADPSKKTGATVALARSDRDRRRGKGSQAARDQASALAGPSASAVGGLT